MPKKFYRIDPGFYPPSFSYLLKSLEKDYFLPSTFINLLASFFPMHSSKSSIVLNNILIGEHISKLFHFNLSNFVRLPIKWCKNTCFQVLKNGKKLLLLEVFIASLFNAFLLLVVYNICHTTFLDGGLTSHSCWPRVNWGLSYLTNFIVGRCKSILFKSHLQAK